MLQLERRRRLSGKNYSQLSALSGIAYKRVLRFFTRGGPLRLSEIEKLSALLPQDATGEGVGASGETPTSGDNGLSDARRPAGAQPVSNNGTDRPSAD